MEAFEVDEYQVQPPRRGCGFGDLHVVLVFADQCPEVVGAGVGGGFEEVAELFVRYGAAGQGTPRAGASLVTMPESTGMIPQW